MVLVLVPNHSASPALRHPSQFHPTILRQSSSHRDVDTLRRQRELESLLSYQDRRYALEEQWERARQAESARQQQLQAHQRLIAREVERRVQQELARRQEMERRGREAQEWREQVIKRRIAEKERQQKAMAMETERRKVFLEQFLGALMVQDDAKESTLNQSKPQLQRQPHVKKSSFSPPAEAPQATNGAPAPKKTVSFADPISISSAVTPSESISPTTTSFSTLTSIRKSLFNSTSVPLPSPTSLSFTSISPDYSSHALPFHGPHNTALLTLEDELNKLLVRLDAVESFGDVKVREERKRLVKEVERELEKVESVKKEGWEAWLKKQKEEDREPVATPKKQAPKTIVIPIEFPADDVVSADEKPTEQREDVSTQVNQPLAKEGQEQREVEAPAEQMNEQSALTGVGAEEQVAAAAEMEQGSVTKSEEIHAREEEVATSLTDVELPHSPAIFQPYNVFPSDSNPSASPEDVIAMNPGSIADVETQLDPASPSPSSRTIVGPLLPSDDTEVVFDIKTEEDSCPSTVEASVSVQARPEESVGMDAKAESPSASASEEADVESMSEGDEAEVESLVESLIAGRPRSYSSEETHQAGEEDERNDEDFVMIQT